MPYRAFVSSTFVDLKDHRAHVIGSLRRAGFAVDPMEDWTADSDEPKNFSQDRLNGCDLCVLLVAFRRGYVPDGETLSITQLEYEAAVKQGIDILPFMLEENAPWPRKFDELEKDPEIVKWRKELQKRHGVENFGLEPRSIDMTGSLGRWLAKRHVGETEKSDIRRVDWPDGISPYPGLLSFDQEYAELFFGRDREVDEVIAKMCEPYGRFLIISGASGSGKSSLVGAGLWRALIKEDRIPGSRAWEWLRIHPGSSKSSPFLSLGWGLHSLRIAEQPEELAEKLAGDSNSLGSLLSSRLTSDRELLLFVDQLEELFTTGFKDEDIGNFLKQLVTCAGDKQNRLRVITTLRSEFIARLEESEAVLPLLNTGCNYHLGPVSPRVLQEMIERPADATGYQFEPRLVDNILSEASQEPGALPLVAYALKQLFDRRQERMFRRKAYQEIGGVAGAIGTAADQVIQGLDKEALGTFDKVFAELVHIERDRPPTRKRATLAAFKAVEGASKLINALAGPECRVLVIGGETREPTVEVAHEKLFTAWPKLNEWIDKGGDALRLIDHAYEAARRWQNSGEKTEELWSATGAEEVLSALQRFGKQASPVLDRFLQPQEFLIRQLEKDSLSHEQRARIGETLAAFGDPRPGVGLWRDGLPYIEWVDIERGKFKLEQVEKGVDVKSFRIAKYPVTQVQFQAFINAEDGYRNDKWWKDIKRSERPAEPGWKGDNFPRENVSWYEALAFCRWLSKRMGSKIRLPTEWEWQLAATGGDPKREYPWPGEWDTSRCNSYESRLNRTSAVGMYPLGATAHGVLDMAGNVSEWCLNVHKKSDVSSGFQRVICGGCWNDYPVLLRSTVRREYDADYRFNYIGFRLAQDLE